MGWDKDSLIEEAKAQCGNKAKQRILSLLPINRQVFSQLQESRASSHVMVTRDNKSHHS